MGAPTPPIIQTAFASDAGSSYITNPIPLSTSAAGAASYDSGFPPATMEAISSGGTPPFGQDMNGILFAITSHIVALESGQPYTYNSTIAGAISGYAVGTVLGTTDGTGLWINTSAGNTTNPDTGGAGWQSLAAVGIVSVGGLTNANITLTAAQAAKPIIKFSGTLTGNLQVFFPALQQEWLIINATAGSYTLTATTASGTGVAILQGGAAEPTGIYCDGTNIYASFTPSAAIPSAVGPVANTLALRDNVGRIFATYFYHNSSATENPAIGSIAVMNNSADGYVRWASLAYAASKIFGTYTQVSNGFYAMPNGFIIQYGVVTSLSPGAHSVSFNETFPNAVFQVQITPTTTGSGAQAQSVASAQSTTGFTLNAGATVSQSFNWLAIGY